MVELIQTKDAAHGKWRGILKQVGFTDKELSGAHGPCPMCEGKDRFRFTDYKSGGEYFCSGCGAGGGFELVMGKLGCDFRYAAREIDKILGTDIPKSCAPKVDHEKRRRDLNALWRGTSKDTGLLLPYLKSRGLESVSPNLLNDIRFHPRMFMSGSNQRHAGMVALVRDKQGMPASIHRTYFDPKCRKMMPPTQKLSGCAIRLGVPCHDELVIGEGIETTLTGCMKYNAPGYAAISADMMAKVQIPATVKEVIILADNDWSFTGQKAAFTLARRLDNDGLSVTVYMPATQGLDFNDKDTQEPLEFMNEQ